MQLYQDVGHLFYPITALDKVVYNASKKIDRK